MLLCQCMPITAQKTMQPYYLMFGREAKLPVDLCFRASSDESKEKSHY